MSACRSLKHAEIAAIAALLPERDRAWFLVGCSTGLRVSELLSLRRGDFTTEKAPRRFFIDKSRMKGGERGRVCWLDAKAQRALQAWLKKCPESALCFPSPRKADEPLSRGHAEKVLLAAAERLRLPQRNRINTHSMRKSFAMRAYVKFKDILKVALVIGHRDSKSTMSYIDNCSPRELWKEINGAAVAGVFD